MLFSNVCGQYSLYIGTARKTGEKVTLKEYFLNKNIADLDSRIVQEVAILSRLSGFVGFPTLRELFIVEGQSLYIVSLFSTSEFLLTFSNDNLFEQRSLITSTHFD